MGWDGAGGVGLLLELDICTTFNNLLSTIITRVVNPVLKLPVAVQTTNKLGIPDLAQQV